MSRHQSRHRLSLAAAATFVLLAAAVSPAEAHDHPTPIERAAPGVVYVEARAKVEVALIEHRQVGDEFGIHIGIIQSTWNPVLSSASGFFVDPNGAIVTAGSIAAQDLDRAKVYAVNQAFHKRYGAAAPLPKDPFARHHIGKADNRNEQRLQACYPPNRTNDAGGCVLKATLDVVVYPYVTSQQRYGNLRAEVLKGTTKDVAVLRVRGANSMPTVAVAKSTAGASALGVLGFTGIPSPKVDVTAVNQHLAQKGGTQLRAVPKDANDVRDAAALKAAMTRGFAGGPVVAESGQVIGLLPNPARAGQRVPTLVTAQTLQQVLKNARVTPHSSPVDDSYEAAMHLFKNGAYAASISNFTRALDLFPGHFRASTNLAVAKARANASGASTAPSTPGAERQPATGLAGFEDWVVVALVAGAVLLAAGTVLLILRRRQRRTVGQADAGVKVPPTFHAAPVPAGKMSSPRHGPAQPASAGASASRAEARTGRPQTAGSTVREPNQGGLSRKPQGVATPPQATTPPQPTARHTSEAPAPATGLRFCTACGARVAPEHRYCGSCGERVR
jgi:S1-C subfamily serine protease